jgi:hypothetical protein
MFMSIESINRAFFKAGLQWLRLPLTTVEIVTGHAGDRQRMWPPAVAFEAFEAAAKQLAGRWGRDPTLVEEGRLQRAKLDQLRRADQLEVRADQERARADDELAERRQDAGVRRAAIEDQADQRKRALERDKEQAERQARQQISTKAEVAAQAEESRAKVVAGQQRQARSTRLAAESSVLEEQRRAVAAAEKASALDEAAQAHHAERKAR